MDGVTVYSLVFAGVGLLFLGLGIPLLLGKVPPNHFYGCRTKTTLSDPDRWYEANRPHGRDILLSGGVLLVASIIALVFGRHWNPDYLVFTLLLIFIIAVSIAAWNCITFRKDS